MVFCKDFWLCNIFFFDYGGIRVFARVFSIVYIGVLTLKTTIDAAQLKF